MKTVLITGGSRGIGKATAKLLVQKGYEVFATSRNPEEVEGIKGVTYLPLDLTSIESIDKLPHLTGPVDILINNAGRTIIGAMEELSFEKILEYCYTNLLGHIRLTSYYVKPMRQKGEGLIINIGSLAGLMVVPFNTLYSITKFGMTAYTIGLRQELKSFGVKVVLVLPGYINTGFPQEVAFDDSSPYAPMMKKVKKVRDALSRNGSPPEVVAKKIWKIVNLKNPSPVYIVGRPGKFTTRLMSLVPEGLREKIISRLYNY